jgi:hypothetical protein
VTIPMGGSSSAASEALAVAAPSPIVKARRSPLAERGGLELSKHDAPPWTLLLRPTDRRPQSPLSGGVAVLAPRDFCNAPRM